MPDPTKPPAKPAEPAEPESPSLSATKAALVALAEKLARTEQTTGRSGAIPRLPKARMFNIDALKAANPDKHYRYVNTDDVEKAQGRVEDGYKAVPEAECEAKGVRAEIGSTRLMELPREQHDARVAEIKRLNESRLRAHKTDVRQAVEAVAKEMRDKHGINLPVERLLVDE